VNSDAEFFTSLSFPLMKKTPLFLLSIILLGSTAFNTYAQTAANPIIKDYGTIYGLDNVTMPDKSLEYKIVIDLKPANKDYQKVNPGLITIARMLNLHGVAGIPKEQLHVVAVLHYTATPIVLNNVGYQKKYGVDNPNLDIIKQLKEAGVDFYICGQSLVARKYAFENVNPDITIALSMLTVVSEHTMKGYSLLVVQ
jgi:intracellular sulfur oxidation DsrE/DsrF family protein